MNVLEKAWREEVAPPPETSMLQWCRDNIVIPAETGTPWSGPYREDDTPWVRGWYQIISDLRTRLFAIQKGAQVGATQTVMNAMFYHVVNDPGPVLYAMDSLEMMRETSKLRLQPIIDASPAVKSEIRGGEDEVENVLYLWKRGFWRLIGAGSPGKASSFSHRFIVLEEPDKYPNIVGAEGNVIENMLIRSLLIWNSQTLINCTPTIQTGFIHKYVNYGDRMFYHVPCPSCGAMIVLRFDPEYGKLTYPEGGLYAFAEFDRELSPVEAGRRAKLVCQACKKPITDGQKRNIVDAGEWRPSKVPELTGHRSCVISGIYSKVESGSTRAFVETFLKSHQDAAKLQIFVNQKDGNVWAPPPKKEISRERIMQIRDMLRYPRGTVPTQDPVLLVMIVDVQAHFAPFAVWAMDLHNQWLVHHGDLSSIDDIPEVLEMVHHRAIWDVAEGRYVKDEDEELQVIVGFMDSRHKTTDVYNFCATHPKMHAIMGQAANVRGGIPVRFKDTDKLPSGKPIVGNRLIKVGYLHPSMFKDHFLAAVDTTLWPATEKTQPPGKVKVWFHEEIDQRYAFELNGEVLQEDPKDKNGFARTRYVKVHTNNQFDLAQYGFAVRHILHNDLMRLAARKGKAAGSGRRTEGISHAETAEGAERTAGGGTTKSTKGTKRKRLAPYVDPGSVRL